MLRVQASSSESRVKPCPTCLLSLACWRFARPGCRFQVRRPRCSFTLLLLFSLWVFLLMAVRAVSAPTLFRSLDSGARLGADLVERRVLNGSAIRFVDRFGSDSVKHCKFNIGWRAGAWGGPGRGSGGDAHSLPPDPAWRAQVPEKTRATQ